MFEAPWLLILEKTRPSNEFLQTSTRVHSFMGSQSYRLFSFILLYSILKPCEEFYYPLFVDEQVIS